MILWDDVLLTMNDDSDTRLYLLDTATGEITDDYLLPGVENQDWEDLDQDLNYIYVGDFGNNSGNRKNLHILRIEKQSLLTGNPSIDTIWFEFSDQLSFDSGGLNQTEFDCEAFVVTGDSIYLFTKQWFTGHTTLYVLPKLPGYSIARKRNSFDAKGLISGATLNETDRVLTLCGYTGLMQPFIYLFYAYPDDDFFAGQKKRINISLPFHQIEGVTFSKGSECFLSNELSDPFKSKSIPPKLHLIDLSEHLDNIGVQSR